MARPCDLYLPRLSAGIAPAEAARRSFPASARRRDDLLVVEDDVQVRAFVRGSLRDLGYRVIEAVDGPTAQKILGSDAPIDLLFTDVVMPGGMTERQTSRRPPARQRPALKTLFTSGYTGRLRPAPRPDGPRRPPALQAPTAATIWPCGSAKRWTARAQRPASRVVREYAPHREFDPAVGWQRHRVPCRSQGASSSRRLWNPLARYLSGSTRSDSPAPTLKPGRRRLRHQLTFIFVLTPDAIVESPRCATSSVSPGLLPGPMRSRAGWLG